MKCPICPESTLVIAERSGIEIDHCPKCRGVWLDRGELDKILERNRSEDPGHFRPEYRDDRRVGHHEKEYKYKKRKSFLEELFD